MIDVEEASKRATARDRVAQAVHYYNENVSKSRVNIVSYPRHGVAARDLYRSNSSLELAHDSRERRTQRRRDARSPTLKREYGSHGSIDVAAERNAYGDQFLDMLQEYKPVVFDLLNDRKQYDTTGDSCRKDTVAQVGNECIYATSSHGKPPIATSPKPKSKFHRFWSSGNLTTNSKMSTTVESADSTMNASISNAVEPEEKQRRRAFAHYDCQSLTAKLGYDGRLTNLLALRRNTTTGASAASSGRSTTPDGDEDDTGDGRCNALIDGCPFFRNEIGGEEERIVSLTRHYSPNSNDWTTPYHRPPLSCGLSILEYPLGETRWKGTTCPYRRNYKTIENVDEGALYYRLYFYKQEHQNWFGIDETLGPIAISIKREKVESVVNPDGNSSYTISHLFRYRLIVRTSKLQTLRGSVLEDAIPNLKTSHVSKSINTKEVLEYVTPEIQLCCLRLGVNSSQVDEQILKLDEQGITRHYKIGILYCKAGQVTEEEMYNNEEGGPAFNEFLELIGKKVRLKGFEKYKAGLDNKSDSTGLYSIYAQYKDCEIMFHVSTMLPFTSNNRQQLLRKRHIGNDIVTIVFQEPGAQPFTPKNIRSQFQHVFIVVRAINPCSDNTQYSVAVSRSKEVALFGPPIPTGATFKKSKHFADFILSKVINGENAAHCSDKFAAMATRTRQAYLNDLASNYSSNTVLESSQKFSIMPFSSKKKERWKPRFVPDGTQRGAVCWQVTLEDSTHSIRIHCFLAISTDSLVLIDESSDNIVFVTPCKSILGWSTQTNSLRLYYHEGECVTMHMRESNDRDELMEVIARLRAVTAGAPAQELTLKRNGVGQLGFHVQPDGVVTQVENMGLAWQAGLRQGARLVEICKVSVATLTHDQMVDLLKTSLMVTVNVIAALTDGSPRRGCSIQNCKYNSFSYEEDGDCYSSPEDQKLNLPNTAALQQPVLGKHKKMYERSFSPPRSSNSSGYGTGSSSKSFSSGENKFLVQNDEILTNGVQCAEGSWYDGLEADGVPPNVRGSSPPPLPARVLSYGGRSNPPFSLPAVDRRGDAAGEKVCVMKAERSREIRRQLEHKMPHTFKADEYVTRAEKTVSLPPDGIKLLLNDGHSTDTSSTSERAFPPSEDELSIESGGNGSPKPKSTSRSNASSSTGCSRNSSPRMKDTGEPRLRHSVHARSSNRNSANLTSSTLQQDLMKLINPDYVPVDKDRPGENDLPLSLSSICPIDDSPEINFSNNDKNLASNSRNVKTNSVIVTTARPATVISNASSRSDNLMTKEERLSLRVTEPRHCLPLPDTRQMDWHSLVDTATKAMSRADGSPSSDGDEFRWVDGTDEFHFVSKSGANGDSSKKQFEKYVSELENRLMKETQHRLSLEQEVHSLRDENRRLQQESQSAAQQLRRFTEWFFQTIDKQ